MSIGRRTFIRHALLGLTALAASPLRAWELPAGQDGRLILIFLRGGLDGLFAFAPVSDPLLAQLRPTLARRVLAEGIALGSTGFAAHPACAPLATLFAAGELAFAPCAGTSDNSRSHFQAQDVFELGTGLAQGSSGFMSRAAGELEAAGAISFTGDIPLAFLGDSMPEVAQLGSGSLRLPGGRLLQAMRQAHAGGRTAAALEQAMATEQAIQAALAAGSMEAAADRGAAPVSGFVRVAQEMGQVLRANPAMNLVFVDMGGFDTHAGEEAVLTRALTAFSTGLDTLRSSLGNHEWQRTRVLVCSEFGRTVRENGTAGTDHGHGGLLLQAGGSIEGGRLLGSFAGLADSQLHESRDLPVVLDWRTALASNMRACLGLDDAALTRVFPGWQPDRVDS